MTPIQEDQERIRLYLLGLLSEDARKKIETDILVNEGMFDEVLIIEDELTDEYVGERLSAEERAHFENHFLAAPQRRKSLRFAQALNRFVKRHPSRQVPGNQSSITGFSSNRVRLVTVAAAVAIVIIVAAALWVFFPHQTAPRTFVTLTLIISPSTRGDEVQLPRVKLPLEKDALKIFLRLPESPAATAYRVQLLNTSGESRSLAISGQDARSVAVEIPGTQLRSGQYALNLFAIKADGKEQRISGSYYFIAE